LSASSLALLGPDRGAPLSVRISRKKKKKEEKKRGKGGKKKKERKDDDRRETAGYRTACREHPGVIA